MDETIDSRQSIQISDDIRMIVDIDDGWVQILDELEGTQVMLSVSDARKLSKKLTGIFLINHIQKATSFKDLFNG